MAYTPTDKPYSPGDPYSYDLKWIVAKIKEALTSIEGLTIGQSNLSNDFEALRQYVYDYFNNLDISQEVEDKINELYADGFFNDIIEEWMNGHIKWTNPNLMDNPWFTSGNVVNQRRFTSIEGTSTGYVIMDRWKGTYGQDGYIISLGAAGYSQRPTTAGTYAAFEQILESPLLTYVNGKTITASIMLADNTIISGSITRANGTKQYFHNASTEGALLQITMESSNAFRIASYGVGHTIKAVKLEMGPYSTLANDAPPNYAEELAKCQRYAVEFNITRENFGIIGWALATSATSATAILPLTANMRASSNRTITFSGIQLYDVSSTSTKYPSDMTLNINFNGMSVALSITAENLTAGRWYRIMGYTAGASLFVSSDL